MTATECAYVLRNVALKPPPQWREAVPFQSMIEVWVFRALWLILPFTAGPIFSAALEDSSDSFRIGVTVGLWLLWAAMLIASMVPRTQTFTVLRIVAPAAFVATVWAAIDARSDAEAWQLVLGLSLIHISEPTRPY